MYPISLDLNDKHCLVVGGGGIALRKIDGLLQEGARVTVVAREPCDAIRELAANDRIELHARGYRDGEAVGFFLVMAATDDNDVNRRVFADADGAGVLTNVADVPDLCHFHLPARVRRGTMQLAIASAGEAPFAVRRMRQMLEKAFGEEWGEWMEAAGRFRRAVRTLDLPTDDAEELYDRFFAATVDPVLLRARVPSADEERRWLDGNGHTGEPERRRAVTISRLHPASSPRIGMVSLVGSGPGDPGLLTVRGRQRLLAADAVVYDRLAKTVLPCDLDPAVELHSVGKKDGHHPVAQEDIHRLLVRLAREGKRVVRLKGGDPFVFGRGGEEAHALRAAGIPFEVVPCVTAGIAAPAYLGIPVTQRDEAERLTMVTAHESMKNGGPKVRWDLLGQDTRATLVGYMGVASMRTVAERLIEAGMDPDTPAAMIERATTSAQRAVVATVGTLADRIEEAGIEPPALFVIGSTVRHAEDIDWFNARALAGTRLGMIASAGELGEALEAQGAEVVEVPLPVSPAARIVLGALPITGWLLRGADEVDALDGERDNPGWTCETVVWTLSPAAAARARSRGWRHVIELAAPASATSIAQAVLDHARRDHSDRIETKLPATAEVMP